jgi:hypothetical protein
MTRTNPNLRQRVRVSGKKAPALLRNIADLIEAGIDLGYIGLRINTTESPKPRRIKKPRAGITQGILFP